MYNEEPAERRQLNYPPFTRLIFINIKHKDPDVLNVAAQRFATNLAKGNTARIAGYSALNTPRYRASGTTTSDR